MEKDLSYLETLIMIQDAKKEFEYNFEKNLNLLKVPCPLFVKTKSGLQDALTGVEKAIEFTKNEEKFEIVHSLAKWKRNALGKYNIPVNQGIYTDMKAIRKDEDVDFIHSLYVEQWDWEKVIDKKDRNIDYLKETVNSIYKSIRDTSICLRQKYNFLSLNLPEEIYFITSSELEDMYPNDVPKQREELITKDKKAVFIIGIGDDLKSGIKHDLRSPDYDDWSLDGDLLIYFDFLDRAVELSSMGIRVDENSLVSQLEKANAMEKLNLPYHQAIINKKLPYSIGGGIGVSRLLMLLLEKKHISEVQASSWEDKTINDLKDIKML